MNMTHRIRGIAIFAAIIYAMTVQYTMAVETIWTGTIDDDWDKATNWDNGVPQAGYDVVVNSGTLTLSSATPALTSYTQGGGVLTFTNWTTKLEATTITLNAGSMTLPGAFTNNVMSNRIWIACTDLTLESGASINADAKGYAYRSGPGVSVNNGCGGGYGGIGGTYRYYIGGATYGSSNAPVDPGSGGGGLAAASGGGAIRIQATNITVNGLITANGGNDSGSAKGAGSGGGIYITCSTFSGSHGIVQANGGIGNSGYGMGGGGGGRIAVIYDTSAQSALPVPDVQFSVAGMGTGFGDIGTLYFPDMHFLVSPIKHTGQWIVPGQKNWSAESLLVSNVWIRFPFDGFKITITNSAVISDGGRLELGGIESTTRYLPKSHYNATTSAPVLTIGGNLTLTNSGSLYVYSAMTNSASQDYGALVSVAGDVLIASTKSWIYAYSHPTNGGSPLFRMRDLTISTTNAGFNADGTGYVAPYGPGAPGAIRNGAGYGGQGGLINISGGPTYGSSNAPMDPGSGTFGNSDRVASDVAGIYGAGGGLVRIQATRTVTLNGQITAKGNIGLYSTVGTGSGGGINITCKTFAGSNGILQANGGNGFGQSYSHGGGGGRIAVWRTHDQSAGVSASVSGGLNTITTPIGDGAAGTIVWGWVPASGTVILIQ